MRNAVLAFFLFACSILCAESHKIVIARPTMVGATQIAPGNYTLEVEGGKALFKNGKKVLAETTVTVETAQIKFNATAVLYTADGKLKSISIKGTTTSYIVNS